MTLEGAISLNETNDYVIYTMNSVTTGQYGVVVPKNISGTVNMLIDLGMKSTFDGVGNGSKTKEQLVLEIEDEYKLLKTKYNFGMLVMPMIDSILFSNIVNNGDKQKMFDEVKKIGAITSELYKKMTENGIAKHMIDQKIIIIEKKTEDIKFVDWLRVQMPNFVDGVLYSSFVGNTSNGGSVSSSSDIFASVPPVEVPNTSVAEVSNVSGNVSAGGIFDNVPPVVTNTVPSINENASVSNVEQVNNEVINSNVTPIISETVEVGVSDASVVSSSESTAPIASGIDLGNIFETKPESVAQVAPEPVVISTSVAETIQPQNVEVVLPVVEAPTSSMNSNNVDSNLTSAVVNNVAPVTAPIEPPVAPVVENLVNVQPATSVQPVNNNIFSSPVPAENVNVPSSQPAPVISNNVVVANGVEEGPKPVAGAPLDANMTFASVSEQSEDSDEVGDSNKSKGFVNLAILLGVIVVVTFVSIEIGKYLYNVYGA